MNNIFIEKNDDGSETLIQIDTGGPLVIRAEDYRRFGPRGPFSDHAQKILAEEAKLPPEEQERLARERRERYAEQCRKWNEETSKKPEIIAAFQELNEIAKLSDEEIEAYIESDDD